jgi:hypothetical protein
MYADRLPSGLNAHVDHAAAPVRPAGVVELGPVHPVDDDHLAAPMRRERGEVPPVRAHDELAGRL